MGGGARPDSTPTTLILNSPPLIGDPAALILQPALLVLQLPVSVLPGPAPVIVLVTVVVVVGTLLVAAGAGAGAAFATSLKCLALAIVALAGTLALPAVALLGFPVPVILALDAREVLQKLVDDAVQVLGGRGAGEERQQQGATGRDEGDGHGEYP